MRGLIQIAFVIMVFVVTVQAEPRKTKKMVEGCFLNGEAYEEGMTAYEDKSHCIRLRCIKRTSKKGKTKFLLKPKPLKGCRCSLPCPKCSNNWDPVCATNNKTYVNGCQLWGISTPCGREEAQVLHQGECGKCPTGCPEVIQPVCGTDNKTYDNECQLLKAACDSSGTLEMAHKVSCDDAAANTGPGSTCKYNNKNYELGETIQYLGRFCLEISCQPPHETKRAKVTLRNLNGSRSCECASSVKKNKKSLETNKSPVAL